MNLLAIDTSTECMSVAVQRTIRTAANDDLTSLWQHTAAGGANSSIHLIPCILHLMQQAQLALTDLDALVFGAGPGSFTGLRTACSVAQGLGFGADVPVLPVNTLLAVAEESRWQSGVPDRFAVTALLDARMGEIYAGSFAFEAGIWSVVRDSGLINPSNAEWDGITVLAGNVFALTGWVWPDAVQQIMALPTATAMLRLAPGLLAAGLAVSADQALPTYIRDKVAQTTLERLQAVV